MKPSTEKKIGFTFFSRYLFSGAPYKSFLCQLLFEPWRFYLMPPNSDVRGHKITFYRINVRNDKGKNTISI